MKKLLLVIIAASSLTSAFAEILEDNSSSSTQIVCSGREVSNGDALPDLRGRCQRFQENKTHIVFWNEYTKRLVNCKLDRVNNVLLSSCKSV